jgi:oligopeptide/dipeptide ABC transporter ATP-binding protein
MTAGSLLSVRGLEVRFGNSVVVDAISLEVAPGEVLGVVGESGSGKSVMALTVLGLLSPPGRVTAGEIRFDGEDLLAKGEREMQAVRGNRIAMIFQEPMTSLNPVFTVGDQIAEALRLHRGLDRTSARRRAASLLSMVEIAAADRRLDDYPHQMSGGMRQRVMIAMALACEPRLLIADEPTTALDVTVQAQILDLLRGLQRELGMAVILITHDLGVIAEFVQRVVVFYAARAVEEGPVGPVFRAPLHPYTEGLLRSIPHIDGTAGTLQAIEGTVPHPLEMPPGCRFHPRCPHAAIACTRIDPPLATLAPGRRAACLRHTGYSRPS